MSPLLQEAHVVLKQAMLTDQPCVITTVIEQVIIIHSL